MSALDVSLTHELPPPGATLVTTSATPQTVGTMAVLAMRADGIAIAGDVHGRIRELIEAGASRVWRPGDNVNLVSNVEALTAVASDSERDLSARVLAVRAWLETGDVVTLSDAMTQVRAQRSEQVELEHDVWLAADGRVAVIKSSSRFAIPVALGRAPVAILIDPAHEDEGLPPYRRVVICQRGPSHVDLRLVADELHGVERGWCAPPPPPAIPVLISSPRGKPCQVPLPRIVSAVKRHLQ